MFRLFSKISNQAEKREIFNLLKLGLSFSLKMVEFSILAWLAAGLAWRLSMFRPIAAGPVFEAGLTIALMLLVFGLPRLGLLYIQALLKADFGLDPRPRRVIFNKIILLEARRGLLAWLVSLLLYAAFEVLGLWWWTVAAAALGLVLVAADASWPFILRPGKYRPLTDDELSPDFKHRLEKWAPKTGLDRNSMAVAQDFSPELKRPRISGLGLRSRLIIPEKALVAFPTKALNFLIASSLMEHMAKAPRNYLLIKICAIGVAAPLAAMFINLAESGLWLGLTPEDPAVISLVWLAGWLAGLLASLSLHLTRRSIEIQSSVVAVMVLKDDEALSQALDTMAERNLEEKSPPLWREFFSPSYGRRNFLKRVSFARHVAEFDRCPDRSDRPGER